MRPPASSRLRRRRRRRGVAGGDGEQRLDIEHPTGFFTVDMDVEIKNGEVTVKRSALLRTARKLMRGEVYIPSKVWAGK
ncbi:MAG: PrpF domain-containing protein [Parvularculaceae bacterium]